MKRGNLDYDALLLFQTLLVTGNLTTAAQKLGMSISTASRTVKELREIFDDELFTRWAGGVTPSHVALELQAPLNEAIEGLNRFLDARAFDPAKLRRTFCIGCVDNGAYAVLAPALPLIFAQAPELTIQTMEMTDAVFTQLKGGEMDLAIFPFEKVPEGFHSQPLLASGQCLAMGPAHPLVAECERLGRVPLEQLAQYRRIEIAVQPREHWINWHAEEEVAPQKIALRTPYFLFAALVLRQTDLTVRLPYATAKALESLGLLRAFDFPRQARMHVPRLVWHQRVHLDAAVQWMRSLIVTAHADGSLQQCRVTK